MSELSYQSASRRISQDHSPSSFSRRQS